MPDTVLNVEDLSISYGSDRGPLAAVEGLEFQVKSGSVLGIVGESGAGKTSVGLALAGLLNPAVARISGRAVFLGKNLLAMSEREIATVRGSAIGMLFQDPVAAFNPTVKVIEQVAESIVLRGLAESIEAGRVASEELARVGIPAAVLESAPYAYMMSGGQCQRAQLAAALAGSPQLLIADEPTSSLDTTHQKKMVDLMKKQVDQKGLAVIFISHDLPLVSNLADDLIVMNDGRMVESGTCVDVLSQPGSDFTRDLIAASYSSIDQGEQGHGVA